MKELLFIALLLGLSSQSEITELSIAQEQAEHDMSGAE